MIPFMLSTYILNYFRNDAFVSEPGLLGQLFTSMLQHDNASTCVNMEDLHCQGNELRLNECSIRRWNATNHCPTPAGINCGGKPDISHSIV